MTKFKNTQKISEYVPPVVPLATVTPDPAENKKNVLPKLKAQAENSGVSRAKAAVAVSEASGRPAVQEFVKNYAAPEIPAAPSKPSKYAKTSKSATPPKKLEERETKKLEPAVSSPARLGKFVVILSVLVTLQIVLLISLLYLSPGLTH
ncbi:MAG: hypothetical protein M1352_02545 [Patescibacteria group bacterium]|nr:hypothetical protein [Patescibacteria group bacterium]